MDFSYRSYHGLFVPSLDVSYRRRDFTYFHCLAVLEQNFSRHTVIAGTVASSGPQKMRVLKNLMSRGERQLDAF